MVSALHATGGGRLVAVACVDGHGNALMPAAGAASCSGRTAGPTCWSRRVRGIRPMSEVLPDAFGPDDLETRA